MDRLTEKISNGYTLKIPEDKSISDLEIMFNVYDRLGHYEDAEEQGLIKILPVAIGCDVYFIPSKTNYKLNVLNGYEQNNRVYHQRVANIVFNKRGWYLECDKNLEYGVDHILVDKLYKETWFTSKEEAEQALADMKGVQGNV